MEGADNEKHATAASPDAAHPGIYDEDGNIAASFLAHIGAAIADRDTITLKRDVDELHQSELGDLLEALLPEQRRTLVDLLGRDFDFSALTEVDDAIRADIVDNLPNEQIAQAVQELDSDDAVYILEDLDQEDQDEILASLPFTERIRLRRALDYPEETAGRRMQTEFVAARECRRGARRSGRRCLRERSQKHAGPMARPRGRGQRAHASDGGHDAAQTFSDQEGSEADAGAHRSAG